MLGSSSFFASLSLLFKGLNLLLSSQNKNSNFRYVQIVPDAHVYAGVSPRLEYRIPLGVQCFVSVY